MAELLELLKALSDETRFKLLKALLTHDFCVRALASHLGISEAAASQHLQILRKVGLVKGEKRGYWTHYTVAKDRLHLLSDLIKEIADSSQGQGVLCRRNSEGGNAESERRDIMVRKGGCEHLDKLKGKPGECSPEQIKECHGDEKVHPCEEKKE